MIQPEKEIANVQMRGFGVNPPRLEHDERKRAVSRVEAHMPPVTRTFFDRSVSATLRVREALPAIREASDAATQARLLQHKAVLASFGIASLSNLGTLTLSGNVVPQPGLLQPQRVPGQSMEAFGETTLFQSAFALAPDTAHSTLVAIGGSAVLLRSMPFLQQRTSDALAVIDAARTVMPVDVPYWAATWINLEDGTNVILKHPHRYLVILTEKLTVGNNVTFT